MYKQVYKNMEVCTHAYHASLFVSAVWQFPSRLSSAQKCCMFCVVFSTIQITPIFDIVIICCARFSDETLKAFDSNTNCQGLIETTMDCVPTWERDVRSEHGGPTDAIRRTRKRRKNHWRCSPIPPRRQWWPPHTRDSDPPHQRRTELRCFVCFGFSSLFVSLSIVFYCILYSAQRHETARILMKNGT